MNRLKELKSLQYVDPQTVLLRLFALHLKVAQASLPKRVRTLRTNELKPWRELREGCLFAFGVGQRMGQKVFIARPVRQDCDYDCAMRYERPDDGAIVYSPVQIKEVVPEDLNRDVSAQAIVNGLNRYKRAQDLTVVLHLNRRVHFAPIDLKIPKLQIGGLWLIGAVSPDQTQWGLWGNFLNEPIGTTFSHPR